ncbi:tape measure protein [Lonsdalea quercina]
MKTAQDQAATSASSSSSVLSGLSRVAAAVSAALSARQVAAYADAWTTLSNKLANARRASESAADVTERVFSISQQTRSSLEGTATIYARLERATRSYGTSVSDLSKLTTIINQGLIVSGATASEAEGTMIQLSQALASGTLRGQEFNSVNEQGNRLIVALADSMGVSVGQMKALANAGKLTTDVVINGLLSQGSAIGKEFANTTTTIGQAMQTASNNITKFVGSSSTAKTGIKIFNDTVITLSESLETVSNIVLAVSAVMGSRYLGALTASTTEMIKNAAASYKAAAAQGAMTAAATTAKGALSLVGGPAGAAALAASAIFYFYEKSQQAKQEAVDFADKLDGVIAKMRQMNDVQLTGTIADLNTSLRAQEERLTELNAAHQENEQRLYIAQKAMSSATQGSWAYRDASQAVAELQDKVAQSARDSEEAENKLSRTKSALGVAQAQLSGQLKEGIELLAQDAENAGVAAGMMSHLGKMIDVATAAKEKFNSSSLNVDRSEKGDKYLEKIKEENDLLAITDKRERAIAEARQKALSDGVQSNSNQLRQIEEEAAKNYDLKESEKEREASSKSLQSAEKKAEKQAERNARVLEEYRQKAEISASSTSELSREQAILAAKNKLVNPTGEQVAMVERDAAAAWDKAAALKAQSSVPELKENADYSKQKEQLELLKSAKDAQGNLLISEQQYHQQSEQLEQDHQTKLAEIRANQAVTPQQDAAAKVDPVQQLANENARKLALIQQYEAAGTLAHDQAVALRNATDTQYEQQRIAAQWQIYRNQSVANELLASSIESFSSGASSAITGLINGTQSLSESFANLGTSVLNGVVSSLVQMGTQWVMSALMGQAAQETAIVANQAASTAALATSTAAGAASAATLLSAWSPAAMAASIATEGGAATAGMAGYTTAMTASQTMAVAGARKNGGPVSAGSMYQVGEGGKPEIFKASNGSQYMIPGDNGSVISNKDLGSSASGGTAIQQTVQFNIQTTGGIDDSTMQKMTTMMKQVSLSTIKDQQRPSGLLSKTR